MEPVLTLKPLPTRNVRGAWVLACLVLAGFGLTALGTDDPGTRRGALALALPAAALVIGLGWYSDRAAATGEVAVLPDGRVRIRQGRTERMLDLRSTQFFGVTVSSTGTAMRTSTTRWSWREPYGVSGALTEEDLDRLSAALRKIHPELSFYRHVEIPTPTWKVALGLPRRRRLIRLWKRLMPVFDDLHGTGRIKIMSLHLRDDRDAIEVGVEGDPDAARAQLPDWVPMERLRVFREAHPARPEPRRSG